MFCEASMAIEHQEGSNFGTVQRLSLSRSKQQEFILQGYRE